MKNKNFSVLLVLLFIFGVSLLVKNQEGYLFVEDREKGKVSDITHDFSFNKLNGVLEDQIYLRDTIIKSFMNVFDRFSIGNKTVCFQRDTVKIDDFFYDNSYVRLKESIKETCANKAYNINEISNKYLDIPIYVYNPVRYLHEPVLDSVYFPNYYDELEDIFAAYLGDKVTYKKMIYQDNEIDDLFYKTDHHYNSYGANIAYKDIVKMINEDIDIGNAKNEIDNIEINKFFRGSYSLSSIDMCDTLMASEYGIDINSYDYYINGSKTSIEVERSETEKTYDSYFCSNIGQVIFDYHDESKKNLLIIADSYIGPIKEVLSTHFNKTVIMCGNGCIENMSLERLIKDNKIDIILVLFYHQNLYFNGYYFIPIN